MEDLLSETPMGALKYRFPIEAAYQLFGIPEEEYQKRRELTNVWRRFFGE